MTRYHRGWTISAIARHLGRDRKTVRAYINGERVPGVRASSAPDAFEPFTPDGPREFEH
jgi:predicted transcriptional regulator